MSKLALRDWASIAEIIGTIAVVISLLFVAYSINHNTAVLQSLNDNLLYEYDDRSIDAVLTDPSMAAILVKLDNAETLSDIQRERFEQYRVRTVNMWELAHDRYVDGLFPEDKWHGWSDALAKALTEGPRRLPRESWDAVKPFYGSEFALIVDKAYSITE